jgi:predicted metal-dependent hydrolase
VDTKNPAKSISPELSARAVTVAGMQNPNVRVVRSARRRRTVTAYRDGADVVVLVPARMSRAEESRWVALMVERVTARERRIGSDARLRARARELSVRYLDGQAQPRSVRWVTNQNDRWGSCTPSERSIRLSHRLQEFPDWVVDYVLVHELAHLLVAGHGVPFWRLVANYPKTERARGFLDGVCAGMRAAQSGWSGGSVDVGSVGGSFADEDDWSGVLFELDGTNSSSAAAARAG